MTRVYRVEDARGFGPYRGESEGSIRYMRAFPDNGLDHPTPSEEGQDVDAVPFEARFGFGSLEGLAAWFDAPRRAMLARWGFVIRAYDAPGEVIRLKHQAIFDQYNATPGELVPWHLVP